MPGTCAGCRRAPIALRRAARARQRDRAAPVASAPARGDAAAAALRAERRAAARLRALQRRRARAARRSAMGARRQPAQVPGIDAMSTNLMIATPPYGGAVQLSYVTSLLGFRACLLYT